MDTIRYIRIEGFRRLLDLGLEMRPLMVLIGANGVGKTSVLDAISLLSSSAAGTLNRTLNGMGGLTDVMTRDTVSSLVLEAEMEVPDRAPLKYELNLVPKGQSYAISYESLSQSSPEHIQPFRHIDSHYDSIKYFETEDSRLVRPDWEHDPLETSLSQVPKMFHNPEELRSMLGSATQYHVLDVGPRAPVKLPQQMKPAAMPGANGEDLIPFLYNLRESDPSRYQSIEDTLRVSFPGFESLSFPPVAAGMLTMTWKESCFHSPLYMHQLSEGSLRFIWLVSLLHSPGLSTVTMIDEPEVSLHPELLSILAKLLREASRRSQIIVATHSDSLVRFLNAPEVLVMDIDEDCHTSAKWADSLNLERWLKEYTLDEVWRMGRLGGDRT